MAQSWVRIIEASFTLINFIVFAWYTISVIGWITGVDIIKQIVEMPPVEFEKIVEQYPEIFYALNLSTVSLIWIDYFAVNILFRRRGMPPPHYILASSLALLGLSITQYVFLRTTPFAWCYIYFAVISALATIHSILILSGQIKEILPKQQQAQALALEEFLNATWGPEELYPESAVEKRRRALRTC